MSGTGREATLSGMPSPTPMSDRDLADFLHATGVEAELVRPGAPTPTVPDAARALGVAPAAIIKSLVFRAARGPVLVIAAGEARVRMPALARALGMSRRAVKLASPEDTLAITGYAVGSMPPFGHREALPTLVDSVSVPAGGVVYGGGGGHDVLLRVQVDTLLNVTKARHLPLTEVEGVKETNR